MVTGVSTSTEKYVQENVFLSTGPFTGRQMISPSTRSNDTMSGISSLAPSKHSSSSHSLASVSFTIYNKFYVILPIIFFNFLSVCVLSVVVCLLCVVCCCVLCFSGIDAGPKLSKSICQSIHPLGSGACGGRVRSNRGC